MTRIYLLAGCSALLSNLPRVSYVMLRKALGHANKSGNIRHKRSIIRAMNYIRPFIT